MLKACFDCLAGDQQRRNDDDTYGVHLNGGTQGAPWQSLSGGKMFPMPALRARNQIIIKGQMTNDRRLNIDLVTSNNTVQINIAHRINESDNEDHLQIISSGRVIHRSEASSWFNDGKRTEYVFRFAVNGDGSSLDVFVALEENEADSYLVAVPMYVSDLKHISANGEVEKLTFIFKENYE